MCFSFCFPCCRSSDEEKSFLTPLGNQAYKADPKAIKVYQEAMGYLQKNQTDKYVEAITRSANLGLADAQCEVGSNYVDGRKGFKKDRIEAKKWFQKAAKQDDAIATQWLALLATLAPNQHIAMSARVGDHISFVVT